LSDERTIDEELAKDIVEYCLRNPQAAGDYEDFARWRLMEARVHHHLMETKKALEWLVARGLLSQDLAGPASIFSLNPERRADAERFVSREVETPSRKRRST
jgi:hypothetical protein